MIQLVKHCSNKTACSVSSSIYIFISTSEVSASWANTYLHLSHCRVKGCQPQIINPRGCLETLSTETERLKTKTAISTESWWRMEMRQRTFFVSVCFGSYQQKARGLVCAPARTEPFPAWSELQTVWVFSIQLAARTQTHKPALYYCLA